MGETSENSEESLSSYDQKLVVLEHSATRLDGTPDGSYASHGFRRDNGYSEISDSSGKLSVSRILMNIIISIVKTEKIF